ncbi:hypothetical protein A5782_04610 [Mycobacterium sp. 852002-40037_SCH5390672]|nr:hypothetical protein A5782_04610 [Mycobacterium sp. 852002-40037_SCH5390672]
MRGAVIYGAGDVRFEDLPEPEIVAPTDAIIRTAATCVCGSDLWDYRGINPVQVAEAYRAMDERRAIKAFLQP